MKKVYQNPSLRIVDLATESLILSTSQGGSNTLDVGLTKDTSNGVDALTNQKGNLWTTDDIWK